MAVLVKIQAGIYAFQCPGCGHLHQYWTNEARLPDGRPYKNQWSFNGNMERPTFTPSLLNTWGKEADPNWQEPNEPVGEGNAPWSGRCHLFVTDGMIQYCGDSWHKLKNQTVPMLELSESITSQYDDLNQTKNTNYESSNINHCAGDRGSGTVSDKRICTDGSKDQNDSQLGGSNHSDSLAIEGNRVDLRSYEHSPLKSNNMSKVKACVDNVNKKPNGNYYFRCPATGKQIEVSTQNAWTAGQQVFGFNGDVNKPTFDKAIKVVDNKVVGINGALPANPVSVNHFIIQDGNIRYLEDCTHHMKGRTMELPELK